jgi:hypothetical protein
MGSRVPSLDSWSRSGPCLARLNRAAPLEAAAQTTAAAQTVAPPGRISVFVFDDLHLTADQIPYAQKASIAILDEALAISDFAAVVTTSGKINSGVTRDRTILTGAISAVRPQLLYRPDTAECPKLNYYQADLVANHHEPAATADAIEQFLAVCNPAVGNKLAPRCEPLSYSIPALHVE